MKELGRKTAALTGPAEPGDIESMYGQSGGFLNLFTRQPPRIVEVRKRELKSQPSGHELAKSHERKSRYQITGGPIHFQEPMLPDSATQMDGSLLPPR